MPASQTCDKCGFVSPPSKSRFCLQCGKQFVLGFDLGEDIPITPVAKPLNEAVDEEVHQEPLQVRNWNWAAFFAAPIWALRHGVKSIPLTIFGLLVLLNAFLTMISAVTTTDADNIGVVLQAVKALWLYFVLCVFSIRLARRANTAALATERFPDVEDYISRQKVWGRWCSALPIVIVLLPYIAYNHLAHIRDGAMQHMASISTGNPPVFTAPVQPPPRQFVPKAVSSPDDYAGEDLYPPHQAQAAQSTYYSQQPASQMSSQQAANDQKIRLYYARACEAYRQGQRQMQMWNMVGTDTLNTLNNCSESIRSASMYGYSDDSSQQEYAEMAKQAQGMADDLTRRHTDALFGPGASDPNNPLNAVDR